MASQLVSHLDLRNNHNAALIPNHRIFQELILARNLILLTANHQLSWRHVCRATLRGPEKYLDPAFGRPETQGPDSIYELARLVQTWRAASLSSFGHDTWVRVGAGLAVLIEMWALIPCLNIIWWRSTSLRDLFGLFLGPAVFLTWHAYIMYSQQRELRPATTSAVETSRTAGIRQTTDIMMLVRHSFLIRLFGAVMDIAFLILARGACYGHFLSWNLIYRVAVASSRRQIVASGGVIEALRSRQCRDPKDKSYAMYGVLRALNAHLTESDYSKPKLQIYRELFVDLLSWRWSSLAMLLDAGTPDADTAASWVPRWDALDRTSWVPEKISYVSSSATLLTQFRTCGLPVYQVQCKSLAVFGSPIGPITYCVRFPETYHDGANLECLHAILSWHWNMQFQGTRSATTSKRLRSSMSDILRRKDDAGWDMYLDQLLTGQTEEEAMVALREVPKVDPDNAQSVLHALRDSVALSVLEQFGRSICGNRLLFITEKGHIGTGPVWMQPGDTLYRISGVPLPMVLRKQDSEETFRVVGPAMVTGTEKGITWLRHLERITLV